MYSLLFIFLRILLSPTPCNAIPEHRLEKVEGIRASNGALNIGLLQRLPLRLLGVSPRAAGEEEEEEEEEEIIICTRGRRMGGRIGCSGVSEQHTHKAHTMSYIIERERDSPLGHLENKHFARLGKEDGSLGGDHADVFV